MAVTACTQDPGKLKLALVRSGDGYLAKKRYDDAILEYRRAVVVDPKFGQARWKLAEAYATVNDVRNALPEYIRAADLLRDNDELQIKAGNLLLLGGRFQDAKTRARTALKHDPKNVQALVLLGNALAGLRELDDAVDVAERVSSLWPTRSGIFTNLGALRLAHGDQELAETAFKQAVVVGGRNIPPYIALANFYRASGRVADAERILRQALDINSRHLQANMSLGSLLVEINRGKEAEPYFKTAAEASGEIVAELALADYYQSIKKPESSLAVLDRLARDPKAFIAAKTRVAIVQLASGHRTEAYQTIDQLLAKSPRNASLVALKARLLLVDHRTSEAATSIQNAIVLNPRLSEVQLTLGRVYMAQGNLEAARRAFNEALDLDVAGIEAPLELAQLHMQRREIDTSIAFAEQGSKKHPESLEASLTLVRSLTVRSEDYPRAENEIKALLTRYPAQPAVHTAWGNICILNRNPAGARKAYERALQLDPDYVDAWTGLMILDAGSKNLPELARRLEARLSTSSRTAALLLLDAKVAAMRRDGAKAEQRLKQAIQSDPSELESYAFLGQLYVAERKLPAATQEFLTMTELDPGSVTAATMLGLLYSAQHNVEEAEKWYERAVQSSPSGSAAASNNLAWLYAERGGNLDQATRLAQSAKAQDPDRPQYNDTLGWVYYRRNMTTPAINTLQLAIDAAPNNPTYQYHLGLALAKAGEDSRARRALESALKIAPNLPEADEARNTLKTLVY